jgi:uncharacterized protein YbgA (DUF1722 family)/uncharacterized protein YbbK (DUF523 family)
MNTDNIKIGVSSCLLGNNVRYDGGHRHDRYITDTLGRYFAWLPVCPEAECGLGIPREAMRLVGTLEYPRLVTIRTGVDHTDRMTAWIKEKLRELEKENLCGFIFKSKSPSSGIGGVKIYTPSGMPDRKGVGLFGGAFMKRFPLLPVIDEGRLHDPVLRENFIERVFVYRRWQELLRTGGGIRSLIGFHSDHKLLIMSHSQKHTSALGRLAAGSGHLDEDALFTEYVTRLMEGLRLIATAKKHTNVLLHIAGYFKKQLSKDEKQELLEVIETYHKGLLPLIVPIVLLKHYIRKFGNPYLERQVYLNPHPMELMLRNHS